MKRIGVALILLLAFFGLADSVYLAQHAQQGTPLICNIQNLSGCNTVASSEYSRVFGIPIAHLGVIFYTLLFVFAALEWVLFDRVLRRVLQVMAVVGIAVSAYSTIVQMFYIKAYCIYCLASALITVFIFVLATLIEPIRKKADPPQAPPQLSMPPTV